jgi:hypothetical protein
MDKDSCDQQYPAFSDVPVRLRPLHDGIVPFIYGRSPATMIAELGEMTDFLRA